MDSLFSRLLLSLLLPLCVVTTSSSQEPAIHPPGAAKEFDFDVIPGDAMMGLAIRDLSDLKRKMIRFSEHANDPYSNMLSSVANLGPTIFRGWLGMKDSIDETGAAAVVSFGGGRTYAFVLPITDIPAAAKAYGKRETDLASGRLTKTNIAFGSQLSLGATKNHVVIGNQDAVAQTLKAKGLSTVIRADTAALLANHDLLLTFNSRLFRERKENNELEMSDWWEIFPGILDLTNEGELDRTCIGLQIGNGIASTLVFDFDGDESRKALTKLQNRSHKSNLNGLPLGDVVFATARSSGPESGDLIRNTLDYLTNMRFVLGYQNSVAPQQAAGLLSILDQGIQRAEVSRAALYRNDPAKRHGDFCLIGILDTDDGDDFIQEIRKLVPIVNASLYPENELPEEINQQAIDNMVSFLSHENSRAREFMMTKLRLLGRRALPALREAAESDNPIVKGRAAHMIELIDSDLTKDRTSFLSNKLTNQLQPDFGYLVDYEHRGGQPIDALQLTLQNESEQITQKLNAMLGPNWNKLRIANVNDQIVFLLGSNLDLFDETLENLRDGLPGIQEEKYYADFQKNSPGELMSEIHICLGTVVQLSGKKQDDANQLPTNTPTSIGVSVSPQQVRVDVVVPVSEFNAASQLAY